MNLPPACTGCPLAPTAKGFCPSAPIQAHTRLRGWGEAPGATEGATGYGFTGASGRLLREWIRRAGLSVASAWDNDMPRPGRNEEVAFNNVVKCVRPGNVFPTVEEAHECLRRHPEPNHHLPQIAFGANAIEVLTGVRLPIQKIRGSILPMLGGGWVVAALHPAFLVRGGGRDNPDGEEGKSQDHLLPTLGADVRRALEHCRPSVPAVSFLQSPALVHDQPSPDALVSVDIEGANGRPNIVGVSWNEAEAYVFPWSEECRAWLEGLFKTNTCTFHNAAYDVPELEQAGVAPPKLWVDTINLAALFDPDQPMNLQTQVLTHVNGSTTWKGLVNHEKGPDFQAGQVGLYRELWGTCLRSLGRRDIPRTGGEWYQFYNGLDTCWGLALANNLKRKLIAQGRWEYYTQVMQPLQAPLLAIGARGMPVDEAKVAEHKAQCRERVAEATAVLVEAGAEMLAAKNLVLTSDIAFLEGAREGEKLGGSRKFSRAKELATLRGKLKRGGEFNPNSHPMRVALLYEWYGLPPIKNRGAKGFTSDDTAVEDLLNRLGRGTIKPKRGDPQEVARVLQAMTDVKKWGVLEATFLNPELR